MMPNTAVMYDQKSGKWARFRAPLTTYSTDDPTCIPAILDTIARRVDQEGLWAVGWISFEAAPAFEPALVTTDTEGSESSGPLLLHFDLFPEPTWSVECPLSETATPVTWSPDETLETYTAKIDTIRALIGQGETYQTNFTFRLRSPLVANPEGLFRSMVRSQGGAYNAYLETEDYIIASASPELFFEQEGDTIRCRPMKGTAPRKVTLTMGDSSLDDTCAAALQNSEKNRAENIMIVDMIRNDLSKVAERDSVRVEELCHIERYPTVYQMTSTVVARTKSSLAAIFQALFPCASITGAPKVATMKIVQALESSPRGVYTGAIGVLSPQRRRFSVAIRTAVIDRRFGTAEFGVGSGVIWDSSACEEYSECLQKASILTGVECGFELFETLRWDPTNGYSKCSEHIARLAQSARFFGWCKDTLDISSQVSVQLLRSAQTFERETLRVRVTLSSDRTIQVSEKPLVPHPTVYTASLATRPLLSSDVFLRHKTTHRGMYDLAQPSIAGSDDIIFWNERGELTESRIGNLILDTGCGLVTPSLSSGLLPGIERAAMVAAGTVTERVIGRDELRSAKATFLINSVRGLWPIEVLW